MNPQPLIEASLAIQIHVAAAVAAFALGAIVLFRRKGDRLHRIGGRIWLALMLVVALSSFFIHTIRLWGAWSPIHLLSVFTIAMLAAGIWAIRRRNVQAHRRIMQGTFGGALVVAGLFTIVPGRIMHEVLLAEMPVASWPLWLLAPLLALAAWFARRPTRGGRDAGLRSPSGS